MNLANLLKIDNNIIKGSLTPLDKEKDSLVFTDYHGKNGLCEIVLPEMKREYNKDFLEDIYDLLKKYKSVKYIVIGPLTNFAGLIDRFPDSVDYIDELIMMGGGFDVSNVEHNAEFNFSMDPAALNKVLASPVNKIIAPLDMTHQLAFSLTDIEDITGVKRELLSDDMSKPFNVLANVFYLNYDTAVKHDEAGAIIHDATTLMYLLDKNKCDLRLYKMISDKYGAVTKYNNGDYAVVIDKMDKYFVKEVLKEMFNSIKWGNI